jgi:hypothetical protein
MTWWQWFVVGGLVGTGLGLFGMALGQAASDRRHERRIKTEIAGRSYWGSSSRGLDGSE